MNNEVRYGKLIACNRGGAHSGQFAKYICAKKECINIQSILCDVCRQKEHKSHPVIGIEDFFTQIKHRTNSQKVSDFVGMEASVDEAERVCKESLSNFKRYIAQKVYSIETSILSSFTYFKESISQFQQNHTSQVIKDLISMKDESDIQRLQFQLKKVLPFIIFSETSSKPPSAILKSISNELLGLPSITKLDIYAYQQCVLNVLQKASESMGYQYSTLQTASRQSANASRLGGQFDESFLSQFEGNTTFLNASNNQVSPSHQAVKSNQLLQQFGQAQQLNPESNPKIPLLPLPTFKPSANFYDNPSRQQIQETTNKLFLTPRGTYKTSDLLNLYQIPNSERQAKNFEVQRNKRGSVSQWTGPGINLPSKQGYTSIPAEQQVQQQANNSILGEFQRQFEGIQKSIDNLRTSIDVQQSKELKVDEKTPNKSRPHSVESKIVTNSSFSKSRQNYQMASPNFFSQAYNEANKTQLITGILKGQDGETTIKNQESQSKISFSEKFQRFREYSRSLSREKGVNTSYYKCGEGNSKMQGIQRDLSGSRDEDTQSKKVKFQFSEKLHHEFVNVSKFIASGQKDNFSTRLVLLEPTVEIVPHREISFSFRIQSCKNMEFGQPLALGLCHRNIVSSNNFEFPQKEERIRYGSTSSQQDPDEPPHGCYLLTSSGFLRNHAYQKQDMKKVPVRFATGDIVHCHFNPFRKTLKFTKKKSQESCTLSVETILSDKLYPCVRISYGQDSVEFIPE